MAKSNVEKELVGLLSAFSFKNEIGNEQLTAMLMSVFNNIVDSAGFDNDELLRWINEYHTQATREIKRTKKGRRTGSVN